MTWNGQEPGQNNSSLMKEKKIHPCKRRKWEITFSQVFRVAIFTDLGCWALKHVRREAGHFCSQTNYAWDFSLGWRTLWLACLQGVVSLAKPKRMDSTQDFTFAKPFGYPTRQIRLKTFAFLLQHWTCFYLEWNSKAYESLELFFFLLLLFFLCAAFSSTTIWRNFLLNNFCKYEVLLFELPPIQLSGRVTYLQCRKGNLSNIC